MVTWDDLAVEINKASEMFERAIKEFELVTKTYHELIAFCKEMKK